MKILFIVRVRTFKFSFTDKDEVGEKIGHTIDWQPGVYVQLMS